MARAAELPEQMGGPNRGDLDGDRILAGGYDRNAESPAVRGYAFLPPRAGTLGA
jgi:hypothetical protein